VYVALTRLELHGFALLSRTVITDSSIVGTPLNFKFKRFDNSNRSADCAVRRKVEKVLFFQENKQAVDHA